MANEIKRLDAKALPTRPGLHADGNGPYRLGREKGHAGWVFWYFQKNKRIERGLRGTNLRTKLKLSHCVPR